MTLDPREAFRTSSPLFGAMVFPAACIVRSSPVTLCIVCGLPSADTRCPWCENDIGREFEKEA